MKTIKKAFQIFQILRALIFLFCVSDVYATYSYLKIETLSGSNDVTESVRFSLKVTAHHADGSMVTVGDGAYTRVKFTCSGGLTINDVYLSAGAATINNVVFNVSGNQTIEVSDVWDPTIIHGLISLNVHRFVDHFLIVSPATVTAGNAFNLTITAQDITGATATTFPDDITLQAETGDINPVTVGGGSFINGLANVPIILYGADPVTRLNKVTVTNTVTYPGQATTPKGMSDPITVNPLAYQGVILLFPGESLTPGSNPGKKGTPDSNISNNFINGVKVIATDQYWNPVAGGPYPQIAFASNFADDDLPPVTNMISNTSLFNNVFRFKIAGLHIITVSENINTSTNVSKIEIKNAGLDHFTFDPGTLTNPLPDQVTITAFNIEITARDAAGNVVLEYNSSQTLNPSTGAGTIDVNPADLTPQNVITFTNGVWSGAIRMTRKASGGAFITIDDGAGHTGRTQGTIPNGPNFDFRVVPGPFNQLLVVMPGETYTPGIYPGKSGSPQILNAGDQVAATVRAVDDFWNVVTGPSVQVPITISCPSGYFEIEPADQGKTLTAIGEDTFRIKFRTYGMQHLVAEDNAGHSGISSDVTVHSWGYAKLILIAPGETLQPGIPPAIDPDGKTGNPADQTAGENFTVTVIATDSYWNPVENPPYPIVKFSSSDSGAVLPSGDQLMGNASRDFLLSLGNLGPQDLTVTDKSDANKKNTVTIKVIPGDVHHYYLSSIASPQNAGVSFNLTIQSQDKFNNLASTNTLINLNSSTAAGTFLPQSVTLTNGIWSGAVTIYKADPAVTISASDSLGHSGTSNSFKVLAGEYKKLILLLPGQSSTPGVSPGKIGMAVPATVGVGVSLTIQAGDEWWNPVAIIRNVQLSSDNFALFTGGENLILNPQGQVFTDVVLKTAILHTVKVTDSSNTTIFDTATITGYATAFAKLQLVLPGETAQPGGNEPDGKIGAPADQIAGVSFIATVYAVDQFWNRISSVNGEQVQIKSSDGSLDLNPPLNQNGSFVNGKIEFQIFLGNSGLITLTASNLADPAKTLQAVTLTVRPGAVYEVETPTQSIAGIPFSMKVRLIDSETRALVNANNPFVLKAFLNSGETATSDLEIVTGVLNAGEAIINNQVYNYVERIKIRVTDTYNRITYSNPIEVVPGSLYYDFEVPTQATVGPPNRFPVTIYLKEGNTKNLIKTMDRQVNISVYSATTGGVGAGDWPVKTVNLFQGKAGFEQSYTKAENVYIVATDSDGLKGVSAIFPLLADTYKKLQILAPGEQPASGTMSLSGKSGTPFAQQVQIPFPVTVRAVDQYWNLADTVNSGKILLSSPDDSVLNATNPLNQGSSFVNGEISFSIYLNNSGVVRVKATDELNLDKFPQEVGIPISQVAYQIDTPLSALAGPAAVFDLTIRLKDTSTGGNIPSSNSFTLTALKPTLEPASGTLLITNSNLESGVKTISGEAYDIAEKIVLRLVDNIGRVAYSNVIDFQYTGINYAVFGPKESPRVGPPDTFPVTLQILDSGTNNIIPQIRQKITIVPYSEDTGLAASGKLGINSVQMVVGEMTINESYTKAERIFLKIYDEAGNQVANSASFNLLPGALADMVVTAPPSIEAGATGKISVALKDAFQNDVYGETINVRMLDSLAKLDAASLISNALGIVEVNFTATQDAAGLSYVRISQGNIEKIVEIKILGAPKTALSFKGINNELPENNYIKPDTLLVLTSQSEIGIDKIYYRIDEGQWQEYSGPFSIAEVGVHKVEYYATDTSINKHTEPTKSSKILYVSQIENGLVNYPNPFKAGKEFTNIEYRLDSDSDVTITIYNLLGDLVWQADFLTGQDGGKDGPNSIKWWGKNNNDIVISNGGYLCQIEVKKTGQKMRRKIAVRK